MLKLMFTFWKLNIKGSFEYKTSFLIQSIWMFISDAMTLTLFYFFFLKFWKIWSMWINEYLILYTCLLFSFCSVHIFFWGYQNISKLIADWWLDSYILLPKNVLMVILLSRQALSVFWDFFFWIALFFFMKWVAFWLVIGIIFYSFFWWLVMLGFLLFFHSLWFFIWWSKEMAKLPFDLMLWPAHYPPDAFNWTFLKFVYLTVVPVTYAVFYPYKLSLSFDIWIFISLISASFIYFWFSLWFFNRWLKKYESGNIINFVQ